MWRITLTALLAHKVRYALTAFAVTIAVAFMAGTLVFTDTIKHTFDGLYNDVYRNTSAVVRARQPFTPQTNFTSQREPIDASLVDTIRRVPGVVETRLTVEGYAQLVGRDGKAIGNPGAGAPTLGEAWNAGSTRMNPYDVVAGGRPPRSSDEVAIDKHSADVGHLTVGGRVMVLTTAAPKWYTITGIVTWGGADSPLGASITLFDLKTAERVLTSPGKVDQIAVATAPGISQQDMVSRLRVALHDRRLQVITGKQITEEGQSAVHKALGFFNTFLLVFAIIALFVGSFLIFNTFSIIVAQRMRELALLRAVGAGRIQVVRSVLGESLLIGAVAAVAGLGAGIGLAVGLRAMLTAFGFDMPATGLLITPRTVVVSVVVGVVITLLAAIVPAWKAGKVAPVAALRDVETSEQMHPLRRSVNGAIVLAAGLTLLLVGLFADVASAITYVGAGAAVLFLGVAVIAPVITRPLSRVIGAPASWRTASGNLARNNAMRNPKRTSAAAAALMIGVALVALISVMASSTKASVSAAIDAQMRADFVVGISGQPGAEAGLSPTLQRRLASLPQVSTATGIRAGPVRIGGATMIVIAADPRHVSDLFDLGVSQGNFAAMTATGIAISRHEASAKHLTVGDGLDVAFTTTGTKRFVVQVVYDARSIAGDFLLPLAAARRNFSTHLDFQVYVNLTAGTAAASARAAITKVVAGYPNAQLMDRTEYKHQQQAQIDQLLNLMYGLLALALLIALIGIANTLALSIHERTHELGLLRAVGMTRGQLRATVRAEAVIIALLGTIEGLVVGTLLGWAVVAALKSSGVTRMSVPVAQLAFVAVLAAVAGMVAAVTPSRRAARLDVLRAIGAR